MKPFVALAITCSCVGLFTAACSTSFRDTPDDAASGGSSGGNQAAGAAGVANGAAGSGQSAGGSAAGPGSVAVPMLGGLSTIDRKARKTGNIEISEDGFELDSMRCTENICIAGGISP